MDWGLPHWQWLLWQLGFSEKIAGGKSSAGKFACGFLCFGVLLSAKRRTLHEEQSFYSFLPLVCLQTARYVQGLPGELSYQWGGRFAKFFNGAMELLPGLLVAGLIFWKRDSGSFEKIWLGVLADVFLVILLGIWYKRKGGFHGRSGYLV